MIENITAELLDEINRKASMPVVQQSLADLEKINKYCEFLLEEAKKPENDETVMKLHNKMMADIRGSLEAIRVKSDQVTVSLNLDTEQL